MTWQISDGYVGGSRPQSFEVDPEDFIGLTYPQVERKLDQMAVEDMMEKVSASISGEDEIINRIIEAAERAEAES